MALNAQNELSYFLRIPADAINSLYPLRNLPNLKAGRFKDHIWVKNLNINQINSNLVKSVLDACLYYEKDNKLYLKDSILPDSNLPQVLWSPLDLFLPIESAPYNHNFFELNEQLKIKLIAHFDEQVSVVQIVETNELHQFIKTSSAIRTQNLQYAILEPNHALVFGSPQLPVPGPCYWQFGRHLLPLGFHFEIAILSNLLEQKILSNTNGYILWNQEAEFFKIDSRMLSPLNLFSLTKTIEIFKNQADVRI